MLSALAGVFVCACGGTTPDEGAFAKADTTGGNGGIDDAKEAGSDANKAGTDAKQAGTDAKETGTDAKETDTDAKRTGSADATVAPPSHPCNANTNALYTKGLDPGGESYALAAVAADCGMVVAGRSGTGMYKTQALLTLICRNGATKWAKTYGPGTKDDEAAAVVRIGPVDKPTGYAVAGHLRGSGTAKDNMWLIRTDAGGKSLWQKTYGGDETQRANAITTGVDDGFVLAGMTRATSGKGAWLVGVDGKGGELWQKTYGSENFDEFHDAATLKTGYAVAGVRWSGANGLSDAWLLVVDKTGAIVSNKLYGKNGEDVAYALTRHPEGGFVVVGEGGQKGSEKTMIVRTDDAGTAQWTQYLGGLNNHDAQDVAVTSSGDIAVLGKAYGSGVGVEVWLLLLDRWGNTRLDRKFGGKGNQWGQALVVDEPAGGHRTYLVAADRYESGAKLLAARLDEYGNASCSFIGKCGKLDPGGCDDGNPCTVHSCDAATGCANKPLSDGAVCGPGKVCGKAACQ